jgi:hypothetical protein
MTNAWYVRDNSTINTNITGGNNALTLGTVGWSAMTGWSSGASITAGTLRRQSASSAVFTASQSTTTLTVTAVTSGTIYLGAYVSGPTGSTAIVTALGTGTGGTGTYTVNVSQTVASGTWHGGLQIVNARAFIAVVGGTTGTSEPNWTTTRGAKTTDNTVTWQECTGWAALNGDKTNVKNWTAVKNTAPGLGYVITDNAGTHIFIITTAGTTGNGSEPSWNTSAVGNTTADGTVTWTYLGTSFSTWAAPNAYLSNQFVVANTYAVAGDTIYLADDHSETRSSGLGLSTLGTVTSPNYLYSIDHTLSLPVSSSGLKTGATVASGVGTASSLNVNQGDSAYWYGVTFSSGSGSTTGNIAFATSTGSWVKLESCTLKINTTGSSSLQFATTNATRVELVNTIWNFGGSTHIVEPGQGTTIWRNTASAIAGSAPTALFTTVTDGTITIEGVDLSALGSGTTIVNGSGISANGCSCNFHFIDCKLGASVTIASTPVSRNGPFVDVTRCWSSASTYVQRRYWYTGTLQEETTVIRTNGASDGTTGISWNITTTANVLWLNPFESFPIAIWNPTTASNVTVTLHGIWNSASLPNNDDIWIDVAYLGDSGSPKASFQSESKSNNLATGSALTGDSASAWDSVASARQNSHAYSLGNVISVSSNSGRLFWCTTAGTSSGSLPVGYAGAIDGGSVTDGTAVFRAGVRFLLTTTLSSPQPQLAGYLRAYVKVAKASSTFYVDPLITLS